MANPPALGAGDRRFESDHPDQFFTIRFHEREVTNNDNQISIPLEEACEIKNLLHEYAGAINREAYNAGNTIKRIGLEKMGKDLLALSRSIQTKVDLITGA